MYIHKLKIGNVELNNNVLLAPMAGITDKAFRIMVENISNPGLVCTEMISSKAIHYGDEKTNLLANIDGEKRPIAIQIFGSEPEIMAEAANKLQKQADIIDINMGCPAPKVVKNGDGSRLLQNLDLIGDIVREVVKNVDIPVTVKMRKGWNNNSIVAVEAAKIIENAGASAITIHGRTREEYYAGTVDLDIIKKVKESVNIPVIGNGDIKSVDDARKMLEYTEVDGIMVGRGTLGNPWLIGQIISELSENEIHTPTNEEKLETIKKHIELELQDKGEYVGIREMRKHVSWYTYGMPGSARFRNEINQMTDMDSLKKACEAVMLSH